ncbi:AMP-binding protein [Roseibacterium sp. SDUM158016]|uniref:class I adenylate-forming enzyme family protein n=1 Tax=Roseicyclus sediminis TaxID=2980997 RepID=UPI0021D2C34A|nr:AMP-binding protein [Roseibacterium sp. SDUM158016]MCU4652116.1 AMP-binding protein [Roseibacterium sp. SDUM158016]
MTMAIGNQGSVYDLVAARTRAAPDAPALISGDRRLSYAEALALVDAIAADFAARGVAHGDRVAILSENRIEYILVQLACAKLGAMAACQNWRLAEPELRYCVELVDAGLIVASERYHDTAQRIAGAVPVADIARLGRDGATDSVARPEDGLLIIYTSGTTGLPKAAVISHRAEIARMCALRLDLGISQQDGYIAWPPMFHMGGTEHTLATLMSGGVGVVIDGFDPDAIVDALSAHRIGWLLLVPATIGPLLDRLRARRIGIKGVRAVGCMADLVPAAEIVAITEALDAPFLNTFGATETGMPPLSAGLIPVGTAPDSFAKTLSILADLRLVDEAGQDVPDGATGEAWMRGPTLFSGYWNAPEANASSFRDGWFRMGDLFRKEADGYHFAGRSKYLIKSGGENIYPAEIERILLSDPRVLEAVVVRRPDAKWGEIPVAVVARNDDSFDAETVDQLCRASLAGYKRPRETIFLAFEDFPRNATGKVLREAIEQMI